MAAILAGSTGLVGSHILTTLLNSPKFTSVHAYSRKPLAQAGSASKLTTIESSTSDSWPSLFPKSTVSDGSSSSVFFSGLGTTKAQAGSIEAQRKIDYELNLALARAAKEAGVSIYVLVSAAGASSTSAMAYSKMKGQLEDDVGALGFAHTIILQPGLILGGRAESRPAEYVAQRLAGVIGALAGGLRDKFAQDAETIARAAVAAALQAQSGERKPGKHVVGQAEIIKLGKTEWKEAASVPTATTSAAAPVPAATATEAHAELK